MEPVETLISKLITVGLLLNTSLLFTTSLVASRSEINLGIRDPEEVRLSQNHFTTSKMELVEMVILLSIKEGL